MKKFLNAVNRFFGKEWNNPFYEEVDEESDAKMQRGTAVLVAFCIFVLGCEIVQEWDFIALMRFILLSAFVLVASFYFVAKPYKKNHGHYPWQD